MFIGEFKHNLDEKGRLAVPVKFRSDLAKGAVITRGIDKCLFVYTMDEWRILANKLANLPISQAKARAFARLMLAGAMDVIPDKQGRINLPEYLRQYAGLSKEAVIAGLYNRLEIWDSASWEQYSKNTEQSSSDISEKLAELGV
ncbi:MAG: division/cell wall cluster transcriptional repressor MraZ [Patescibacteria group bacterium]|nr:division/cell wall cluster transcriptional repressor MraZ [Patescibacteria group bacterium]